MYSGVSESESLSSESLGSLVSGVCVITVVAGVVGAAGRGAVPVVMFRVVWLKSPKSDANFNPRNSGSRRS